MTSTGHDNHAGLASFKAVWDAEIYGRRRRRRAAGATKAEVQDALKQLDADLASGIARTPPASYTVRKAAEDWLDNGLPGRAAKTIRKKKDVLEPILAVIGAVRLRELDAAAVDKALTTMVQATVRRRSAWATSHSNAQSG